MNITLRFINAFLGSVFTFTVIYLLVKKKISEKNSLLWLAGSTLVFVLAIAPQFLEEISTRVGVAYPPSLLFLFSTIILMFITLFHSIQISLLNSQIKELMQHMVVKEFIEKKSIKICDTAVKRVENK